MRLFLNAEEKDCLDNFPEILAERDFYKGQANKLSKQNEELVKENRRLQSLVNTKKAVKKGKKS